MCLYLNEAEAQPLEILILIVSDTLMESCLSFPNRPDPARLLITFDARVNLVDRVHGNSALHWAATSGNHVVVKLLMDKGADLEMTNSRVRLFKAPPSES